MQMPNESDLIAKVNHNPGNPKNWYDLSLFYLTNNRLDEALSSLLKSNELASENPNIFNLMGVVYSQLGSFDKALTCLKKAVGMIPDNADFILNLGCCYLDAGEIGLAKDSLETVLALRRNDVKAFFNLGKVFEALNQYQDAINSYNHAIRINPDYIPAINNLGLCYMHEQEFELAEKCYRLVIQIDPNERRAYLNLIDLYTKISNQSGMLEISRQILERFPGDGIRIQNAFLLPRFYTSLADINWWRSRLDNLFSSLENQSLSVPNPVEEINSTYFYLSYQGKNDRIIQKKIGNIINKYIPHPKKKVTGRKTTGRIKIGFLSKFFYRHTMYRCFGNLILNLPTDQFDVTLFHIQGDKEDDITRRYREGVSSYVSVPQQLEMAQGLILSQKVDLLVFTDMGMDIFTYYLAFSRLAPIQIKLMGHPVTTGIPNIDYFVSSKLFEVQDAQRHYTEKLILLTNNSYLYQPPEIPDYLFSRSEINLPENKYIFSCPMTQMKLHPEIDAIFCALLRSEPQAVVVLLDRDLSKYNLLNRIKICDDCDDSVLDRILFLPWLNHQEYFSLIATSDVILDTIHFGGGGITTLDAFSLNIPVVTMPGKYVRSRLAAAQLDLMDLNCCVANNAEEYIYIALELVKNKSFRNMVIQKIKQNKDRLFDYQSSLHEYEELFKYLSQNR